MKVSGTLAAILLALVVGPTAQAVSIHCIQQAQDLKRSTTAKRVLEGVIVSNSEGQIQSIAFDDPVEQEHFKVFVDALGILSKEGDLSRWDPSDRSASVLLSSLSDEVSGELKGYRLSLRGEDQRSSLLARVEQGKMKPIRLYSRNDDSNFHKNLCEDH